MSDFRNTSDWKIKDGTTLAYAYDHNGKRHEGEAEKKPNRLNLQLERLSVMNQTSWELERDREPKRAAGFYTREHITALGILDNCRLHAITLDDNENETFTKLHVEIHPVPLEKLQETSKVDTLSIIGGEDNKPAEGWMKDEIGAIHFHGAGEYYNESQIFASVFLSQDKFDDLVLAIKAGGIRSARMEILADVFEFAWEGMIADIRDHKYNYAILCEGEEDSAFGTPLGARGETKARLQEVLLEWAPTLDKKTAAVRDEPDDDDCLEPEMATVERNIEKVTAHLARDVQGIRRRMDTLYQGAILVAVYVVIHQVSKWLGF